MTVADFWDMTPRETIMAMEAGAWRLQQEQALVMSTAWHAAAFQRAKRLPALSQVFNRMKPRKKESLEQRRAEFEELKRRMMDGRRNNARHGPNPDPGDAGSS